MPVTVDVKRFSRVAFLSLIALGVHYGVESYAFILSMPRSMNERNKTSGRGMKNSKN